MGKDGSIKKKKSLPNLFQAIYLAKGSAPPHPFFREFPQDWRQDNAVSFLPLQLLRGEFWSSFIFLNVGIHFFMTLQRKVKRCKSCHQSVKECPSCTNRFWVAFYLVPTYVAAILKALNKLEGFELSLRNSNHQAGTCGHHSQVKLESATLKPICWISIFRGGWLQHGEG